MKVYLKEHSKFLMHLSILTKKGGTKWITTTTKKDPLPLNH